MPLNPATATQLEKLLRDGATNRAIADELGIAASTAGRARKRLGISPARHPRHSILTIEETFWSHTRPMPGGQHLEWAGYRTRDGSPKFFRGPRHHSARAVAFRIANGRDPQGTVLPECEHRDCVAPACVEDQPGRLRVRAQLAALEGYTTRDTCSNGHPQATYGRYRPSGEPYCDGCGGRAAAA